MDKINNALLSLDTVFETAQIGRIYRHVIEDTEKALIEKALERSCGNQIVAAKFLGLNRNTLRAKIRKLNISTNKFR